ncbi:hypothetical protein J3U64_03260 [Snodgrassella sp. B3800]|uniref:DUF6911 family protein n=1 Tax=Snodgrassella sp. B3800 TaxID=2818039 RepID=UPI00226A206B|nr:hypothetical protein [Snodgrassella sp. B3800]MCX8746485.1 hypothetical protein [Snodgrassella sp. B3800]
MKTEFKFNGTLFGNVSCSGNPTLEDINNALDLFASSEGVLYLIQDYVKGTTPYELTLYADKGKYLVMFSKRLPLAGNEDDEDNEDDEVRTFWDSNRSRGMVDLQGDLWDNRVITEDFTKVRKAFNEFYLTGDIDRNLVE